MIGLGVAILAYYLVSKVWSILDPDSFTYHVAPGRALFALAAQVAVVVLAILACGLSGLGLVLYLGAFIALDWGAYKVSGKVL